MNHRPTIAEINLTALNHNIDQIFKKLGDFSRLLPIIKANAYGHGAVQCALAIKKMGIPRLGVATIEEGIELRESKIDGEVLVLGGLLTDDLSVFKEFNLTPVIHHWDHLQMLSSYLEGIGESLSVHLKMDTGMGRLGFWPNEIKPILAELEKCSKIKIAGVMTHLARADEKDQQATDDQFKIFGEIKKKFSRGGLVSPVYHIANSAAIIDGRFDSDSLARPGIMLYGAYPNPRHHSQIDLTPVMTLKTKIMAVKNHPKGSAISYGCTFVTKKESRIAILPVGYADGYPRLASNKGHILIHQKKAPVVGRVCMDLTMVDVTGIPEAKAGDEAVLFGVQKDQMIRVEEVAGWAQTISYEVLCGVSQRVLRVYQK